VIKVMGIIGALDPYKYKVNQSAQRDNEVNLEHSQNSGKVTAVRSATCVGESSYGSSSRFQNGLSVKHAAVFVHTAQLPTNICCVHNQTTEI
jgi:hypothetical protein